jgi:hypothetical protein
MATAKITFESLQLDSQDYAMFEQSEAHVVSTIRFHMEIDGKQFANLVVGARQPYGTDFESEPLEIGRVTGYQGPWNHAGFAGLCEHYSSTFRAVAIFEFAITFLSLVSKQRWLFLTSRAPRGDVTHIKEAKVRPDTHASSREGC